MRPFTLLIKPASADCNLRCAYCFYLEKCHLYPDMPRHRMSAEVLEQVIKSYMATPQPMYSFGWQGGEPTLMGLEFFEQVIALQKTYGRRGSRVSNGLQTNAMLISEEMARLFGKYRFLVGCSLDGPADLHDRYRRTVAGKPTQAEVLRGIETLQRHQVEYNILTLVSQANVAQAREVFRYLVEQGHHYHQYIPCVEFDEEGNRAPFAIQGQEWGEFLCNVFDEWYPRHTSTVSIRNFDTILGRMLDGTANVCTLGQNCCQYFVVEYNGDMYPCDFFVEEPLKIGNVLETSWEDALASQTYQAFGAQKAHWNAACDTCRFLDLCAGDCLKHRVYGGHSPQDLSWLCAGWQHFFRYTRSRFEKLAERLRRQRLREARSPHPSQQPPPSKFSGVGRNDLCPCGSGRKFKKCCGA
ncbi:anaerobic sulfatase maturase [candidate division KSB3 bacterium]|uniref:Anaerobic sulfatase maturase n=1 Tax=candidate division KSB3 bacterium TaxID=2044937 RepID=A0A9D5JT41_9BACT|nr:anaerobic sulfatase maturase [candidate division KSB3 bacterium]MBD3323747.1 anaerobic sulfatase maturase [candidate division KSB3 bacterium]